jgi:large subunit ribosomal protein L32
MALQNCPQCSSPKRPHRLCGECGYYAGELRVASQDA